MIAVLLAGALMLVGVSVGLVGSYVGQVRRGARPAPWKAAAWRKGERWRW